MAEEDRGAPRKPTLSDIQTYEEIKAEKGEAAAEAWFAEENIDVEADPFQTAEEYRAREERRIEPVTTIRRDWESEYRERVRAREEAQARRREAGGAGGANIPMWEDLPDSVKTAIEAVAPGMSADIWDGASDTQRYQTLQLTVRTALDEDKFQEAQELAQEMGLSVEDVTSRFEDMGLDSELAGILGIAHVASQDTAEEMFGISKVDPTTLEVLGMAAPAYSEIIDPRTGMPVSDIDWDEVFGVSPYDEKDKGKKYSVDPETGRRRELGPVVESWDELVGVGHAGTHRPYFVGDAEELLNRWARTNPSKIRDLNQRFIDAGLIGEGEWQSLEQVSSALVREFTRLLMFSNEQARIDPTGEHIVEPGSGLWTTNIDAFLEQQAMLDEQMREAARPSFNMQVSNSEDLKGVMRQAAYQHFGQHAPAGFVENAVAAWQDVERALAKQEYDLTYGGPLEPVRDASGRVVSYRATGVEGEVETPEGAGMTLEDWMHERAWEEEPELVRAREGLNRGFQFFQMLSEGSGYTGLGR